MKKIKLLLASIIIMLPVLLRAQRVIPYSVAGTPWEEQLGNQRAVLSIKKSADAVQVQLNWRRRDQDADRKCLIITDDKGNRVKNILRISIDRETGTFVFEPIGNSLSYYVYYMPWQGHKYDGAFDGKYLPKEPPPDNEWVAKNKLTDPFQIGVLPAAKVLVIQSRTAFDSFYPMEVVAKKKEVNSLVAKAGTAYLVFPEDRKYPVRMLDALPYKWIRSGTSARFTGTAARNEYYVLQLAVFAAKQSLSNVKIEPLNAPYAITCFNTEGYDSKGTYFTKQVDVEQGKVQPFWIGLDIPKDAKPGTREFKVKIVPRNAPAQIVTVSIHISNAIIANRGDDDLWRLSRLRWLNSRMGIDDNNTSAYTPLQVKGLSIQSKMSRVTLNEYGLPKTISINQKQLLQQAISFVIETANGPMVLKPSAVHFLKKEPGVVEWKTLLQNDSLQMELVGRMESDGYLHYRLQLRPGVAMHIRNIHLDIDVPHKYATYFMGMGLPGELTPETYSWKWHGPQDAWWTGDYDAGIYCKLLGATYAGPLLNLYHPAPPPSWYNNNAGGFTINRNETALCTKTYTGDRELLADSIARFEFSLLITPFKQLNTAEQFTQRYYQSYLRTPAPSPAAMAAGVKIVNVHHATPVNPYINYPFVRADSIKKFADQWHKKGVKTKIYYTIRELSDQAAELWALRSLGTEVYADGKGGGYVWLREHLVNHYDPQWFTPIKGYEASDAAILMNDHSRWFNYYIEGLNWLLRKTGIDGLYLDDVTYNRDMLKRMRKVMEGVKPGCIIDLHSNTGFSKGPATQYTDFFPYIDKIWFGESFLYNRMSPANWLVETSGIPFGLMGDMLYKCGNQWRGMLYGMSSRLGWSTENIICDPIPVWKLWDRFGIDKAVMKGYWEETNPVTTNNPHVLATAYIRNDSLLVAIASWDTAVAKVIVHINEKKLGWVPGETVEAPEILNYQPAQQFDLSDPITIEPGKGWLLLYKKTGK